MSGKIVLHNEHFFAYPRAYERVTSLDPKVFGKVAVLIGGESGEREVSLESGRNVLNALKNKGVDAHPIDATGDYVRTLLDGNFDRAFIILHGKYGEDGRVQGALESIHMPYTGSDVASSALAMDKPRAKLVMDALGLPTPPFGIAYNLNQANTIAKKLGLPLAVKPVAEGSSLGTSRVDEVEALEKAFNDANQFGPVLLEPWLEGFDVFVGVLGGEVFPAVQVQPEDSFYDYEAKYKSNKTQYFCPAPITMEQEFEVRELAKKAFYSLGCTGWGRIDFVHDIHGKFWILEVNTIPGMTSHSLVPLSAKQAGLEFDDLVLCVLATSLDKENVDTQKDAAKVAVGK